MDDIKQHWAPVGLEQFGQLESKIFQTVEEIRAIRKEAEDLRGENSRLNEQVNERIRENETLRGEIDGLKRTTEEYEKLCGENEGLRQQVETMRQAKNDMLDMLTQFEKERDELRDRVEKTLTLLTSLDPG